MKQKAILSLVLSAVLLLGVGCKKNTPPAEATPEPTPEVVEITGSLEEIMQKVYDGTDLELPMLGNVVIDKDNVGYYLGVDGLEFTEGLASEALINAIAHSVCLVRLPDGADVEAAKADIRQNCNPNKWICVGVDDSNVVVDNIGNLVILIMADGSDALHKSFLALADAQAAQ